MKRACLVLLAFGAALLLPATGHAAPPGACAADWSGWTAGSLDEVTDIVWAGLIEPNPFNHISELRAELAGQDRNGDGDVCLHIVWGEQPNPNANWFGVELFIVRDNHTNGH
jgi:hypothetical protein